LEKHGKCREPTGEIFHNAYGEIISLLRKERWCTKSQNQSQAKLKQQMEMGCMEVLRSHKNYQQWMRL